MPSRDQGRGGRNDPPSFGCNSPLHFKNRIVAAKTGTTDHFKDADTIMFTPTIAAGLWVGDILGINHYMTYGSDGVFVATPGLHTFLDEALAGAPGNLWYAKPADVVEGATSRSWYLVDATSIRRLPGDNPPSPTPKAPVYVIPPDPGTGPVLASPLPTASPSPGLPAH